MPAYYQCGCEHPDADEWNEAPDGPDWATEHAADSCPACERENEYDDDDDGDGDGDYRAARDVAAYVSALLGGELPQSYSPSVTRSVSCEWEATSGVATAQIALNELTRPGAGFEYHSDSTCDGELVFSRLRLCDRDGAERYARSLATIAELHRRGHVAVGMRAGHHIHIGARDADGRGMSSSALVSLYSVFAHCEDLLYRLASAGWSKHRDESSAGNWAKPIPKLGSLAKTPRNVGNAIGGEKYQGLNIGNYIANIRNCRCGAFSFGDWEECTCSDDYATIEWRLFNAAVSPRKIRAYIAIAHCLTDYAATTNPRECSHLIENPFTATTIVNEDSLARQFDWLMSRPGFTERDRDDLMWLASISPGMGRLGRDAEALQGEASGTFA